MIFEKWFDIRVQCLNALLLNRHKAILKKIYFLNLLQGIPNFEVRIFEKYTSQKINQKQFWDPLAEGYKMPYESEFYEVCARK